MGGGCLAPKPNEGDLALQLIDELHAKPANASREQKYVQNSPAYSDEKQKMFKKGALRKLVDYLSSHRHRLIDSLAHNLKVCIQNGKGISWTNGLIILERVTMMGTQGIQFQSCIPKIEHILRAKGQNSSYNESEVLKGDLRSLKTETDKQNKSGYHSIQTSASETVVSEIMSARFESVLLDTVNACLEEPSLYKECLRILGDYLQIKQKCLHNEDKAHALLRTLMENLKTDYESLSTLEAYYRLLSKLKEKVVLSMCPQLKVIIKMWIQSKKIVNSSKSISTINDNESKISWLELIIGRFLACSLNGMEYNSMIKLLMEVQDEYFFGISLEFESLYVYILSESELGAHFLKALFLEFLRCGVMGNFSNLLFNEIAESSRQLLSCHSELTYKNIKDRRSRQNLYDLLKRWLIIKKYISLGEIISYHSSLFLYCFLQNQYDDPCKNICIQVIKETTPQQKIILLETVFDIYQRKETTPFIRNLLMTFHRPLIDCLKEINLKANISRFAIDSTHLNSAQALQLYTSLMQFYAKFDKETTLLYMQQICQLLGSMVTFLHQDLEGDKEKLTTKLLVFIQFIVVADAVLLAVAFYHQVQRIIDRKSLSEEMSHTLKKLVADVKKIFDRNSIQNLNEDQTDCEEEKNNPDVLQNSRYGEYSCYFKELVLNDTKSKFLMGNEFEKANSILKDSKELKEEDSVQDILEMINY